jgi:hypothetical protein
MYNNFNTNLNDLIYTTFNTIIENTFNMENGYINKDDILDLINGYIFDKSLYNFLLILKLILIKNFIIKFNR